MSQAPGWYHAQGDPEGTMRYWDGEQWVGEPTTQQSTHAGSGAVVESDPIGYWKMGWQRWNDFSGRSRRAEYWWFSLINFVISILLQVLSAINGIGPIFLVVAVGFALASILPSIAAGIRRLHDTNRSGWWMLIAFLPILGAIVLLVFTFTDGDRHHNDYGASPKYA